MEHKGNGEVKVLLLAAGALIGAGIALLLAPQSGKKTRKDLTRYARKAKAGAEDAIEDFADNVFCMVDGLGDRAARILSEGKDLAYDAKKELLQAIEEGQKRMEKQRARVSKLID